MEIFDLSTLRIPRKTKDEKVTVIDKDRGQTSDPLHPPVEKPAQVEIVHTKGGKIPSMLIVWFLGAYAIMLSVGVLHVSHPQVPLLSYWDALLGLLILGIISDNMRSTKRWVD